MKRLAPRFALFLLVILPVPFIYNACHGSLLGSGFSPATAASCKVALAQGQYVKVQFDSKAPPAAFAARKVRLRDDAEASRLPSKPSAPMKVPAGTKLAVIADNNCLQANAGMLSGQPISQMVAGKGELYSRFNRQAYEWELERDYTDSEIENLANNEACVVGLSWNRTYKVQNMAFNDPSVSLQAHLPAINAFEAYDYFYAPKGGMAINDPNATPVMIAVVDTGLDWQHPDIQPNVWVHSQGVGVDATTIHTNTVNFNPTDISPEGHGTHVSGIIAAAADNGVGIVGAMPFRAMIMPIRVFQADSAGNLSTSSNFFYNAMQFAYLNNASVVNLSLDSVVNGPASDSVAESGVDEAVQNGVTVVVVIGNASSGNGGLVDGVNLSTIPGMYAAKTGVIGVGAFDTSTGQKSYFSHYSTTYAEIGAPGEEYQGQGLYSTVPTALNTGGYGRLAGTSQAAPQVAAAAGLAIGLIKNSYSVAPTPAEVERLILTSASHSAALAPYFQNGNRLDLVGLVAQINQDYPLTRSGLAIPAPSCPP